METNFKNEFNEVFNQSDFNTQIDAAGIELDAYIIVSLILDY
jgi:hypothetical protein